MNHRFTVQYANYLTSSICHGHPVDLPCKSFEGFMCSLNDEERTYLISNAV